MLIDRGDSVIGMHRRTANSSFGRLQEAKILNRPEFRLCSGDLTDYSSIDRIIKEHKPDVIGNLGASSHVGESFKNPIANLQITGGGCVNVLEAVRNNINTSYSPKFFQMSSSEMFGSNFTQDSDGQGVYHYSMDTCGKNMLDSIKRDRDSVWQDEETPLSANSPYAAAKIYAHNMTELYREAYGMYANSMICFNMESEYRGLNFVTRKVTDYVANLYEFKSKWNDKSGLTIEYHFYQNPDYITVVDLYNDLELDRIPKLRLGNLEAMRDWTYAEDACEAILLSLEEKTDTYCICSGEARTIEDLCKIAFKEIGVNDYRDYIVIDPLFYRPVEVPFLRGDSSKIRRLGWNPKIGFEDIISRMVGKDIDRKRECLK